MRDSMVHGAWCTALKPRTQRSFRVLLRFFFLLKNQSKIEHNNKIHDRNGNDEIKLSELDASYLRYHLCAYRPQLYLLAYRASVQSEKIKSKEYDLVVDRIYLF